MDEKALTILASMLDKARIQANAIEATAQQPGVYGDISNALHQTVALLTDAATEPQVYQAILDGCSVEEALRVVKNNG